MAHDHSQSDVGTTLLATFYDSQVYVVRPVSNSCAVSFCTEFVSKKITVKLFLLLQLWLVRLLILRVRYQAWLCAKRSSKAGVGDFDDVYFTVGSSTRDFLCIICCAFCAKGAMQHTAQGQAQETQVLITIGNRQLTSIGVGLFLATTVGKHW